MQRRSLYSCALLVALAWPAISPAQVLHQPNATDSTAANSGDITSPAGIDILSDTGGVNVGPYIKQILGTIYKTWTPLLPQEARPPQSQQGETQIRFKILPDGRIGAMWLDGSTHDDAINRACWGAITRVGQFPPLPAGLETKPLVLRIHFYVNTKPHSASATSTQQ